MIALGRRTVPFLRPHTAGLAVVLALTMVGATMDAVEPLLNKLLFDSLGAPEPLPALTQAVAALVVLAFGRQLVGGFLSWITWRVKIGVHAQFQRTLLDRLHSLPLSYFRDEYVGSITTRMDRGISGCTDAVGELAWRLIPNIVYLLVSMVAMFLLEWRLFLLVLALVLFPVVISVWAAEEQTRRERLLLGRWSRLYGRLHEVLNGIATVKSFARERMERRRFMRGVRETNRIVLRGIAKDTSIASVTNLTTTIGRVAAGGVGGYLVLRGEITIGTVVAFLSYTGGLFGPMMGLTGTYQALRRSTVALKTVFDILDAPDPLADPPSPIPIVGRIAGRVDFERVAFAYPAGTQVIQDFDLHVHAGEHIALVGPSGAGKSTLMMLLQRFEDPTQGMVRIDGVDLRRMKSQALRRQIGTVLQDTTLFNDTVRANIAYGCPSASSAQIEAAAAAANAAQFIAALPESYATVLGERGARLSGGQRQRIAIARALLKDPRILILDEATSSLDAESEALVQDALQRLLQGRTSFIIAHRLATVVRADRIVVLRDGRILEIGAHEDLVRAGGYYAWLVEKQTEGLLFPSIHAPRSVA